MKCYHPFPPSSFTSAMDPFSCDVPEHFLLGTLIVRTLDRRKQPVAGIRAAVGGSREEACRPG
jgi:hypothetical protein